MMRGGSMGTKVLMATTALALLLAGCTSGDPAPEPVAPVATTTSAEPSPTPTSSPTAPAPTKPVPPADLSRTDEVGAAAAATYFVSLYAYVMNSGDVAEWSAMSGDPCTFCSGIRDDALNIAKNGETYSGGSITPSEVHVLNPDDLIGGYPVEAKFVQGPTLHVANDGHIINQTSGDSGTLRIDTINGGNGWKIFAVVVADSK